MKHAPALALALVLPAFAHAQAPVSQAAPLNIGETFTIESKVLGEVRRINVYVPELYGDTTPIPVLYMPDGGIGEDFLHVAGLVQISVMNGTMRPFMLVGIENTQRRRDLTGPTQNAEDRKIAAVVGRSAAFRRFIRDELMPAIKARYRTTGEAAIIGESLAGLFIVETFFLEPDLFDTYIAFDPSLWWNDATIVKNAATSRDARHARKTLYLANSSEPEIAKLTKQLADVMNGRVSKLHHRPMPEETHATIYHPAALSAVRMLFAPEPDSTEQASADTLSIIDLYGFRKVPESAVRAAIGVRVGDPVPRETDQIVQRLRAIPGVADADISIVCCAEGGGSMMFAGIREPGTPAITHRPPPTGSARLPEEISRLDEAFSAALISAVRRGVAGEDHSHGYALAQDSALRAIQQQFVSIAAARMDTLRVVLNTSADADHRALAAYIIAYGPDRRAVARDLMRGIDDPDDGVRNNAVRAIGVLASWLNDHPEAGIIIPAEPFIDLLNSVSWPDRNKGVMALMALTARRDTAVLSQLRLRAAASLIEMARWTNPGHAFGAFIILARVVGIDDGEAFQAWQQGRREEVVARAEKLIGSEQR